MKPSLSKLIAADPVQAALSLADVIREQAKEIASLRVELGQLQQRYDAAVADRARLIAEAAKTFEAREA